MHCAVILIWLKTKLDQIGQSIYCLLKEIKCLGVNEWMNKYMNEWMNEYEFNNPFVFGR